MDKKLEVQTEEKKEERGSKIKVAELEEIIIDLAKKGESPARIGLILRDKYHIPKAKLYGKKISKILKLSNIQMKPEKEKVREEISRLNVHAQKNKHDHCAHRSLTKKLWIINKLEKQELA